MAHILAKSVDIKIKHTTKLKTLDFLKITSNYYKLF